MSATLTLTLNGARHNARTIHARNARDLVRRMADAVAAYARRHGVAVGAVDYVVGKV